MPAPRSSLKAILTPSGACMIVFGCLAHLSPLAPLEPLPMPPARDVLLLAVAATRLTKRQSLPRRRCTSITTACCSTSRT
jgi:hypothetical protein